MLYFAYGSNLHLEQMLERCKDAEPLTQAILEGYQMIYRRGVATVEKASKRDRVFGAVYKISKRDLAALDRYEGYPILYYRELLQVETRGMGEVKAITYMMHKCYRPSLPRTGYYKVIEEGYRNWALPIEALENTVTDLGSVRLSIAVKG
ncbi:MAG: gamma-glutamylcyclotransferase [bacterium]|nr:gamma-glutamylcyclotransferase [bacterium]